MSKDVNKISLREVLVIVMREKMTMRTSMDNYIHANWKCVWCASSIWIGMRYVEIPSDVFAYFLSPQQYEEFANKLKNEGEQ